MSTAQAVLRGFRVSWEEWTRRPAPRLARAAGPVAGFKCWIVLQVPTTRGGEPSGTAPRR